MMTEHSIKTDTQARVELGDVDPLLVLGSGDENLRLLQRRYPVRVVLRDGVMVVLGDEEPVRAVSRLLSRLVRKAGGGRAVVPADIEALSREEQPVGKASSRVARVGPVEVRGRTPGQQRYMEAIATHDVVFGIGPAGTGKTFLAVSMAVAALNEHQVERILLVRPAVEAGESLGFLPGDYREKVDPYLRPLYDALGELMPHDRVRKLIELGVIEIAPLAYMRGRTLNRAFVILDEGQNTTVGQMKMFLTRLGPESRAVITGDITQIDLSQPERSGLVQIQGILSDIDHICFVYLTQDDVVRHRLVREIIRAFEERAENEDSGSQGSGSTGGGGSHPAPREGPTPV